MIQPNELRLNNWCIIKDKYHKLNDFDLHFLFEDVEQNILQPIPLTPEILEKCGFKKREWSYAGDVDLYDYLTTIPPIEFKNGIPYFIYCKIEYLHTLQNLFFALTQKELEINL